jgi:hypothetical protein
MTESKRMLANRQNARHSTGPATQAGKAVSSQNARRHGLLSQALLVPGESVEEYDFLLAELQSDLRPQGVLENGLVERIAAGFWRQRRLLRVESAKIQLRQLEGDQPDPSALCRYLTGGRYEVARDVIAQVNLPLLGSRAVWAAAIIDFDRASEQVLTDWSAMQAKAPKLAAAVAVLADYFAVAPQAWLDGLADEEEGGVETLRSAIFLELHRWDYQPIRQLLMEVHAMPANHEQLSRYQSSLDNDLYKAMRALREAQNHRLACLPQVAEVAEA